MSISEETYTVESSIENDLLKAEILLFLLLRATWSMCVLKSYKEGTSECHNEMSRVVRKPAFCICENKDADQLRGNREADQRLCFRYTDSTIPLLPKYEITSC